MKARTIVLALAVLLVWPAPGRAENVLRWASAIAGLTFDPHAFNHPPTRAQNMQVYESLVDFDPDHSIKPGLAVAWRLIADVQQAFSLRIVLHVHRLAGQRTIREATIMSWLRREARELDAEDEACDELADVTRQRRALDHAGDLSVDEVAGAQEPGESQQCRARSGAMDSAACS